MTTFRTQLAKDHAAVIAQAKGATREMMIGRAIGILVLKHKQTGDTKYYLDAEDMDAL